MGKSGGKEPVLLEMCSQTLKKKFLASFCFGCKPASTQKEAGLRTSSKQSDKKIEYKNEKEIATIPLRRRCEVRSPAKSYHASRLSSLHRILLYASLQNKS
jgi:hypothetical protein